MLYINFSCSAILPLGLPDEFSLDSTFRKTRGRKDVWNLLRIEGRTGRPQFGVLVNGRRKSVEVYSIDIRGQLQTQIYKHVKVRLTGSHVSKLIVCSLSFHVLVNR